MASTDLAATGQGVELVRDVREGLARRQKELPPKYFYDQRGSELFEDITRLPEYYLTRAERALLRENAGDAIGTLESRTLVELGAGSGEKTRLLIEALHSTDRPLTYVPVDLSATFLEETSLRLSRDYPRLAVEPVIGDISRPLDLPEDLPEPRLFAFLGSTIGNFDAPTALAVLRGVRAAMADQDAFLLGADLRKDTRVIERAYNDAAGVTAAFNRNVLHVLNRELGAGFPVDDFEHMAFYNPDGHQIEMHLASRGERTVPIPGVGDVRFRDGETIRTEISRKYDRDSLCRLLREAGLTIVKWMLDERHGYALLLAEPL